jgi:hypothetical protein
MPQVVSPATHHASCTYSSYFRECYYYL